MADALTVSEGPDRWTAADPRHLAIPGAIGRVGHAAREQRSGESTVSRLTAEAQLNGFHTIQVPDRPNPYIPADPELLKQMPLSSKLRTKLRQVRRKLAECGSAQLRRVDTYDREALDRFYRMDASGWKGQEGTAILRAGTQPFYDEIAKSAAHFGYFSLYMLELKGELMAVTFCSPTGTGAIRQLPVTTRSSPVMAQATSS